METEKERKRENEMQREIFYFIWARLRIMKARILSAYSVCSIGARAFTLYALKNARND